jgi:hypothetical protein
MADRAVRQLLLGYLRHGLLTVGEAADIAGVARNAVYKWCVGAGFSPERARRRRLGAIARKVLARAEERTTGITVEVKRDQNELGPQKRWGRR